MPDVHLPGETAGDRYTPLAWVARGVALTISVVAVAFPCGVGIYRVFGWRMPTLDVAPFSFPVIEAGLVFLAWYAARVNAGTRVGRAMALFAIAWAMYCAGSLLRLDHHGPVQRWWVDLCYVAFFPVLAAGLLSIPMGRRAPNERWKFVTDVLSVLLGSGIAIWYLVVLPSMVNGRPAIYGHLYELAYPLGDVLIFVTLIAVLLRRVPDGRGSAFPFLWVGLVLFALTDLVDDLLLPPIPHVGGVEWRTPCFMIAMAVVGLGLYGYSRPASGAAPSVTAPEGR